MIKVKGKNETQLITEATLPKAMEVKDNALKKLDEKFIGADGKPTKTVETIKSVGAWSDIINTGADAVDNKLTSLTSDRRSIIARAKNSVLQFPIYIVDNVNISAAHIVAKAFDRVYASFVQSVLSQYPVVDEDSINDLAFLKQFHTNLKESVDATFNEFYQPIDDFDLMMQESVYNVIVNDDGVVCRFQKTNPDNIHIISENARLLNEPLCGFEHYLFEANDAATVKRQDREDSASVQKYNPSSNEIEGVNIQDIETLFTGKKPDKPPVKPKYPDEPKFDGSQTDYDKKMKSWIKRCDEIDDRYNIDLSGYQDEIDEYNADMEIFTQSVKDGVKTIFIKGQPVQYDRNKNTFYISKPGRKDTRSNIKTGIAEFKAPVMLRDSEIKKINGMLPYTFDASFAIKTKNNTIGNIVHYIVGVKSVLHLIKAQDLSDELQGLIVGDIKNLQKVRYKTGEISFWKDYIFRKDELKRDASKELDSSKKWINTLKHLADYNKTHGTLFDKSISSITGGDIPIPNATLILTQPVVQQMKNDTGINLEDVNIAKKLARNLFLIAICILDSSAGNMKVMFTDNDTSWDVQSIASIEAEVSKTDNSNLIKELNKVINK